MNIGKTVFAQLMDFVPTYEFQQCVKRYRGNHKVKTFSCWDQFLCMAFAQLTYRERLRDIDACLRVAKTKLYHMGIRGKVSRNTLTKKRLVFLTNNFSLLAAVIGQLYKCRWQVELFFKWIKQYLRIKAFYGTTENSVETKVWIAISVYGLVAIIKKRLGFTAASTQFYSFECDIIRENGHFTGSLAH